VLHAQHQPDLVVRVVGKQFAWTFEYPSLGITSTELRVPKDRLVRFELASTDVLHSFWIPEFRVKQDVVPGRTIAVTATATKVGSYGLLCAELCGLGHTVMHAPVEVMDQVAFDRWAAGATARGR
jgi:cytochrome c oxidase subunit 2